MAHGIPQSVDTVTLPELAIARCLPARGCSMEEARGYTRWLARVHYENFHVATWLLPRGLRQHFCNVYAYCRWADDLADEIPDPERSLSLLRAWEEELRACYRGQASHPVFVALADTIARFEIPAEPFADLLTAFRQDQRTRRYPDWQALLEYCRYSANPVGRLVLYLCGYRDAGLQRLSDATCTALQLTNFWQDVSRDLDKGRIYIPLDLLALHGLDEADLQARHFDDRYAGLMRDLLARTRVLFSEGWALTQRVDRRLRVDLELFSRGGLAILDAIELGGYDTLHHRPAATAWLRLRLLVRALYSSLLVHRSPVGPNPASADIHA